MKKILMLLQSEFPPDIRLEKEIKSLNKKGFDVTLLCNQYSKSNHGNFEYCNIFRIKALFNNYRLNKFFNFPIFFNLRIITYALSTTKKIKPNFIHAHDLPMVPLGLILKKIFKIPLIYDMHENYPDALKFFDKKGFFNFIFKNPKLAEILDKYLYKKCDRIIVVVEENKQRLIETGVNEDKIFIVSNTVDLDTFGIDNPDNTLIQEFNNKFVLLYTGKISPERGLDIPLLGMKMISSEIPNALLLIVGDGEYKVELKRLTDENNLNEYVRFIPWKGHGKLNSFLSIANICIIPQPFNDFINTTIPHKLFEYMSKGKIVLVSDAKPLKRIIEETESGTYFKSNDSKDFAIKVIKLSKSKIEFGKNGLKAVKLKYNWRNDSKILLDLYQNFYN